MNKRDHSPERGVTRRQFLTHAGAGAAGAVALTAVGGRATTALNTFVGTDPAGAATTSVAPTSPLRFGRIFGNLPPFEPSTLLTSDTLKAALRDIGKPGGVLDANDNLAAGPVLLITDPALNVNNANNPTHTAGTTFVGQFLDHDITFDTSSTLGVPTDPANSPNGRTPAFDLDSVYGGGPVASPQLYDPTDPIKLKIESGGLHEDLPRQADNSAIIGDPRNDENMMIAGLQCAFILFHNHAVDDTRSSPPSDAPVPLTNDYVFKHARTLTTWHYHWIIVNEFLPLFVGQNMVDTILSQGRRFYRPPVGGGFIPVEFQGACYRFGHSMVRPSYRANFTGNNGSPFFGLVFDPAAETANPTDPDDLVGACRAPRRFIGWHTFFDFADGNVKPNKLIDRRISTPLFNLPLGTIASHEPPTALPQRTLLRHITWSLPSGQDIARVMDVDRLTPSQLRELDHYGLNLTRSTPLWYYTLAEAELVAGGKHLGPVGGRIVGEVILGLLQTDPNSYLVAQPTWKPTAPRKYSTDGGFRMIDFLAYAGVDANR
jgi:Animal haem peroxidase